MLFSPPTKYSSNLWRNMRVGILGGSFNPAHEGHRHISLYALKYLNLDAVWWMVSPQNPLKSKSETAPLAQRIFQAQKVANHSRIVVTGIEQQLNTRYTSETLKKLKVHFPTTNFIWLMGTDNLQQVTKWQKWNEIFESVEVGVLDRPPRNNIIKSSCAAVRYRQNTRHQPGSSGRINLKPPALTILHIPTKNVSSTEIRRKSKLHIFGM